MKDSKSLDQRRIRRSRRLLIVRASKALQNNFSDLFQYIESMAILASAIHDDFQSELKTIRTLVHAPLPIHRLPNEILANVLTLALDPLASIYSLGSEG